MRCSALWIGIVAGAIGATACDGEPATDAGVDAGPVDAGVDAGPVDAGPNCTGASDGTSCGPLQICLSGMCRMTSCGDSFVDMPNGEECEDGNAIPGDGCEPSCQWTCTDNVSCDDTDVCTGVETCQVDHTCNDPPDLDCDDANPCTMATCDPVDGCAQVLIDADGDGYAWTGLGACTSAATRGGDCNDTDASVYPTATDGCDPATTDNDCDGSADEDGAGAWYADCDGDGVAATGAQVQNLCAMPTAGPAACTAGSWTLTAPIGSTNVDCDDAQQAVNPRVAEIVGNNRDDNCDGGETCYRDFDNDNYRTDSTISSSDSDCMDAGESPTGDPLEWATPAAANVCCDQNADMHAGQTRYFTNTDSGPYGQYGYNGFIACPGGRRWDFNCDGSETLQYSPTVGNCYWEPAGCSRGGDPDTEGWFGLTLPPSCGAFAQLYSTNCHYQGGTSCSWDLTSRFQGCR